MSKKLLVEDGERRGQFSSDARPFGGFERIMLEEDDDRRRLQEGDVGSDQLGLPVFGVSMGWRLR